MCGARGFGSKWHMLAAMVPLIFLLIGFKWYCRIAFDDSLKYYTKGEIVSKKGSEAPPPIDKESRRRDRVAVRFGHPALWQKLTVPMVHKRSQHHLATLYRGRLDGDLGTTGGFSDTYIMKRMSKDAPGKEKSEVAGGFEFVSDQDMDFENFKNRPEFAEEVGGGDGSIYGHVSRPDTPSNMSAYGEGSRGRSSSRDSERTFAADETGVTYPAGYHNTPSHLREYSPSPDGFGRIGTNESNPYVRDDGSGLLGGAAPMGRQTPTQQWTPYSPEREGGQDYFRR